MNTRLPLIVLIGSVAASPALPADITASRSADAQAQAQAQAQAAMLLRAEITPLSAPRSLPGANRIAGGPGRASAQTQAADLLIGHRSFSSARVEPTDARVILDARGAASLAKKGAVPQDAQAQAQSLLRAESPRNGNAIKVKVVAVSR